MTAPKDFDHLKVAYQQAVLEQVNEKYDIDIESVREVEGHPGLWQATPKGAGGVSSVLYARSRETPDSRTKWRPVATPVDDPALVGEQVSLVDEAKRRASEIASHAVEQLKILANDFGEDLVWRKGAVLEYSDGLAAENKKLAKLFMDYFGSGSLSSGPIEEITGVYRKIAGDIAGIEVINWAVSDSRKPGPDTSTSIRAFTLPTGGDPIRLTQSFWKRDAEGRAIDLLHESTHYLSATTDDSGSGIENAKKFASTTAADARRCAYNFEYFAIEVLGITATTSKSTGTSLHLDVADDDDDDDEFSLFR